MRVLLSAPYMIPEVARFEPVLAEAGVELLVAQVDERLDPEQLMAYAGQVDGVLCGDDGFSAEVLQSFAPRLKVISKWGTGIDSIDQHVAAELGIQVLNTPGAFTEPVADSVISYILAFARQTPWMDRSMKVGDWRKVSGRSLAECTVGVIGVGNIGKAVLERLGPFGPTLLGVDPIHPPQEFLAATGVKMTSQDDLLKKSDYVSLNCDLNPTSYHLIGSEQLRQMKSEAVLINTARGPIVDEPALIEALQEEVIRGAALDVFETEPLPTNSPLRQLEQVLLAPHNANSSPRAWERVHENTLRNLLIGLGLPVPSGLGKGPG